MLPSLFLCLTSYIYLTWSLRRRGAWRLEFYAYAIHWISRILTYSSDLCCRHNVHPVWSFSTKLGVAFGLWWGCVAVHGDNTHHFSKWTVLGYVKEHIGGRAQPKSLVGGFCHCVVQTSLLPWRWLFPARWYWMEYFSLLWIDGLSCGKDCHLYHLFFCIAIVSAHLF